MADIVEVVAKTVMGLLIERGRSIGGIVPDIVVEETGRDATFVTVHPVETGAAISDHSFQMPAEVEMRCGWSDSSGGFQGYSDAIYEALQGLQRRREPFVVVTGKRVYQNMLIIGLEVSTTQMSEYALFVRVILREILITSTQMTTIGGGGSQATQAQPARTSGVTNAGERQPKEVGRVFLGANVG